MPIQPIYFQPLSFDQNNPFLMGMKSGADIQAQQLQNSLLNAKLPYANQSAQESLLSQQLANALKQNELTYAPETSQAKIAQMKALTGLYGSEAGEANARTGLTKQQADLLRQKTPYLVQQEQEKLYSDPILSRLYQLNLAQQGNAIPQDMLQATGLVPDQSQTDSQQPYAPQQQFGQGQPISPVTAPKMYGGSPSQNWALFGSPLSPLTQLQMQAYGKGLDTSAQESVKQWNNAINSASDTANDAIQMKSLLDDFKNSYGKAYFTGPTAGTMPSSGPYTFGTSIFHDFSPEQQADNAAQNMQQLVIKLMHTNKLTNYELQFAGGLKLNRQMTPEIINHVGNFLEAKSNRMSEEPAFLNAARSKGIDFQTANTLWQMYNNQRPVYNFSNSKKNEQYSGSWNDYLTPEAISSVQSGAPYVPNPEKLSKDDLKALSPTELLSIKQQMRQKND